MRDRRSREGVLRWSWCGLPAGQLALPQLFLLTFPSVGGKEHFVRVVIDWVNNGKEPWLWFWIKNVGLVFVLTPFAFFAVSKEQRAAFSGAVFIFVVCELLVFQPNEYDNNKLLYVAYAFGCFVCADALAGWLGQLRSPAAQGVLLALTLFISSNAAVFTLGRRLPPVSRNTVMSFSPVMRPPRRSILLRTLSRTPCSSPRTITTTLSRHSPGGTSSAEAAPISTSTA